MSEELRSALRAELSGEQPPPLGDLVATVVRDGRRIRRRRRLAAAAGGTAAAGVVAVAMALGAPFGSVAAPASEVPASSAPAPTLSPSMVVPGRSPVPSPTLPPAKATPEGMLVLLGKLLPAGRTGDYAKTSDGALHIQMYLDRGEGPGMIRLSITGPEKVAPKIGKPTVTVDGQPDNCVQDRIVRAVWPDGLTVQADLASCLAWDGKENKPGATVLTDAEAGAVVADPRWGTFLDSALVEQGFVDFPKVPYFK